LLIHMLLSCQWVTINLADNKISYVFVLYDKNPHELACNC